MNNNNTNNNNDFPMPTNDDLSSLGSAPSQEEPTTTTTTTNNNNNNNTTNEASTTPTDGVEAVAKGTPPVEQSRSTVGKSRMHFDNKAIMVLLEGAFEEEVMVKKALQKNKNGTNTDRWNRIAAKLSRETSRNCTVRSCRDKLSKQMAIVEDHTSAGGVGPPTGLNESAFQAIVHVINQKKESDATKVISKEDDLTKQGNELRRRSAVKLFHGQAARVSGLPVTLTEAGPTSVADSDEEGATPIPPSAKKPTRSPTARSSDCIAMLVQLHKSELEDKKESEKREFEFRQMQFREETRIRNAELELKLKASDAQMESYKIRLLEMQTRLNREEDERANRKKKRARRTNWSDPVLTQDSDNSDNDSNCNSTE